MSSHSGLPASVGLDEQIGQMLIIGFRGCAENELAAILHDIRTLHVGGVVLFDRDVPGNSWRRNIESPEQLARLSRVLQNEAKFPLLIAVDQEGGRVARLSPRNGFPSFPSHQQLGEENQLAFTHKTASDLAALLAQAGINWNFAPCVDIHVPQNPVIGSRGRSFTHDPALIAAHAGEFITAHQRMGVLCAVKHFPGHGSSRDDSHLGMVDVTDCWQAEELLPFRFLIERHLVDAVMSAHVMNHHWDSYAPATLSAHVISGILRRDLDFAGVAITDDLQMGAIVQHFGFEVIIEKAITAGNDLLLFGNNGGQYEPDIASRAIETIRKLVTTGRITGERIHQSFERIQKMKQKWLKR
ncbi:MAG: glycoside hydrolase family 3 protein [Calditrichaeota bacterium]|nr:MAG: glycoside hydrolase family 3 protein [Calditrichota bacterium]